jgi:hypothetical protein
MSRTHYTTLLYSFDTLDRTGIRGPYYPKMAVNFESIATNMVSQSLDTPRNPFTSKDHLIMWIAEIPHRQRDNFGSGASADQ